MGGAAHQQGCGAKKKISSGRRAAADFFRVHSQGAALTLVLLVLNELHSRLSND